MNRLITSVLFGLVTINTVVQADPSRPRLVVGIVVDQLRTDYIEYLQSQFGERGFKRLMKDGLYARNVDFHARNLDLASATAMLYTGSYPAKTGVPSAQIFNPEQLKNTPALYDASTLGNFTDDAFSPASLRLSTISDELAIDGGGLPAIYAFASDPQQAIIMAGHAGTGASWINDETGNWATTTFYKELPTPLSTRNYGNSLSSRIDTMQWKPSVPIEDFIGLPAHKRAYPFRYTFPRSDRNVYRMFEQSALANTEITDVAIDMIRSMSLGKRGDVVDMLNLAYTAAPFEYAKDGDPRAELQDTYIRLDSQLGRLFDAIDRYVGLDNTLVWVWSTGYFNDGSAIDPKYKVPTGEFSTKRASSLLNSYLSARHGNGDYIVAFHDGHLYLDHKVLESKRLDAALVAEDVRSFLCKMSGVADAFTLQDILSPSTPELEDLRLSIDPKNGGDVYVEFNPGWTVTDDTVYPSVSKIVRNSMVLSPAFIMGAETAPRVISEPVDATALSPTVAGILRIRSPNGAQSHAIP